MTSKVYFIPFTNSGNLMEGKEKLNKLILTSGLFNAISPDDNVAVKLHFGEEGNTSYIRADLVATICDAIARQGGSAFLSDTNTLYPGKRTNCSDHRDLAYAHGFTKAKTGVEVVIPDDYDPAATDDIAINQHYIKNAKVARLFTSADALVVISHFKGHMMSGFGGAIKNVGMGCAMREGKLAQHCNIAPVVHEDKCIGCGACLERCPSGAIQLINTKAHVDAAKCIGCAGCVGACQTWAMFVFSESGDIMQKKMSEYCLAVLRGKKNKSCFINFAININKECDCWPLENPRIGPDLGIFISHDPVSIDKACFDLVAKRCRKDIFKDAHPEQNSQVQLEYAHSIGLGNLEYELIQIEP